jgi:hypothetical protein
MIFKSNKVKQLERQLKESELQAHFLFKKIAEKEAQIAEMENQISFLKLEVLNKTKF